jgi:thiol:disulfide interchange protein DsbD
MRTRVALFSPLFLLSYFIQAQTPYSWTYTAKKTADKTYEIHCIVEVNAPWHTYSQTTPDGGPLPTKFEFSKSPLYTLVGTVKENGKMVTKHEEVFGVDVKYFDGKVDFLQVVKLKASAKTNLSGSVTFMVCNDEQCLPPTTQKFNLALN